MSDQATKLPAKYKLSYGVSEFGKALFIHGPNLVWLFFLTEVLDIPPATAGLVILAPMIWDAVTDPLVGYWMDRTRLPWGKYVPYIFFAAPIASLAFVFFFTDFGLQGPAAAWSALLVAIFFRTALTVVDVPHNGLMARVTSSSSERSAIAGAKMFFNAFAMVAIAIAVRPILSGDGSNYDRFTLYAGIGAVIAVLALWQCAWFFRRLDTVETGRGEAQLTPMEAWSNLSTNHYLWILLAVGIVAVMLLPSFAKTVLYFAKYNLGDEAFGGIALLTFTLATALSIPLWGLTGRKVDKARLLQLAHATILTGLVLFYLYDGTARPVLLGLMAIIGIGAGGANVLTLALVPDVVEYGQWKTGKRVEAGVFGCFTFSAKAGNGLGAGLLGLLLGAVGFVANTDQSPETLTGIKTIMTLLPAAGSAIVIMLLARFDLGHEAHARLVSEIGQAEPAGAR
ncbi:MFS transporter [Erythrobacter rubeus]|uniref:MFS transporter n=1 Tax=Erythrobacter rubeus TaxID=2760803 RepID=A0ABR8KQS7_9SPHN|nr:glycoside-pentoside-hexuronide (GPH):cation symporter [Erythrobacter rubeus]MBD2841890.1 MFS transporter [Erythrobacter rubeus]